MTIKNKLRIALFTDTYDEVNGVANTFRYLTSYCSTNSLSLDIYCHATDEKDSVEQVGSVRIYRYKPAIPLQIYFDSIFDLKLARFRIISSCLAQKYNLIHTATPGSMGLNALVVAGIGKIPLISSYHTTLPEYVRIRVEKIVDQFDLPTKHSGERIEDVTWGFMKWYYEQTQLVLAPSEYTKMQLRDKLNVPVGIFSRGIDTEKFSPRFREEHDEIFALYVGRVSLEKNLAVLTDIFNNVDDAKLIIVGDGPYLAEMKEKCPNAIFKGFLKGDDLSRAYASAGFFVFPSTTDTFGNVILEAMSSGIPVVVTDKMGPKELVNNGKTGFITTDNDDFGEKVQLLIKDAELRKKMGAEARNYAATRSWDAVFGELFDIYKKYSKKS